MLIEYLPPVLFTIFFFGMCLFYYHTYLSMQDEYIQLIIGCFPILLMISAIQLICIGPGQVDQSTTNRIDTELFNELQQELQLLMEDEQKLLEILEQNDQQENITEEQIIHKLNLKIQERKGIRICRTCNKYKPQRTHHCSECQICILRMDHHCIWLNCCIDFCLIIVLYTYFRTYINSVNDTDINLCLKLTFYHGIILLFLLFCPFYLHHVRLAMNNQTTIEFYEKNKENSYYINVWENLKEMWGNEWYFWLLPI